MNITDKIIKCKEIKNQYEKHHFKELKDVAGKLTEEISDFIYNYQDKYELTIKNSVYDQIVLYDVNSRVKDATSLYEKLIRKNELKYDNIPENSTEIDRLINNMDDLIGIKIVTNLSEDCNEIHQLIKDKLDELKSVDLYDVENVPERMKNGRLIYKIKGCYKDEKTDSNYKFELQIKSKIDSAWGDLEHTLYYKDYDYHSLKDDNKKIMVNIGSLLEEVEKMMLVLRQSKRNYKGSKDKTILIENINDLFKEQINKTFRIDLMLNDHYELLYDLIVCIDNKDIKYTLPKKEDIIDYFSFEYETDSNLIKNFNFFKSNNNQMMSTINIFLNLFHGHLKGNENYLINHFIQEVLKDSFLNSVKEMGRNEEIYLEDHYPIINNFLNEKYFKSKEVEKIFTGDYLYTEIINSISIVKEIIDDIDEDESFILGEEEYECECKIDLFNDIVNDIIQVLICLPEDKRLEFKIIDEMGYNEVLKKVIARLEKNDMETNINTNNSEKAIELLRKREVEKHVLS